MIMRSSLVSQILTVFTVHLSRSLVPLEFANGMRRQSTDCGDMSQRNWTTFPGSPSQYKLVLRKKHWSEAKTDCQEEGGHLIEIESAEEQKIAYQLIHDQLCEKEKAWIGLTDNQTENVFVWESSNMRLGESEYSNWKPDNKDCVTMYNRGYWQTKRCSDKKHYICERAEPCLPDWSEHLNSCYIRSDGREEWLTAQSMCNEKGGNLISIESKAEQQFAYDLSNQGDWKEVWIALNDRDHEKMFVWEGTSVQLERTDYTNWKEEDKDCVCLDLEENNGQWHTEQCKMEEYYICEKAKAAATMKGETATPTATPTATTSAATVPQLTTTLPTITSMTIQPSSIVATAITLSNIDTPTSAFKTMIKPETPQTLPWATESVFPSFSTAADPEVSSQSAAYLLSSDQRIANLAKLAKNLTSNSTRYAATIAQDLVDVLRNMFEPPSDDSLGRIVDIIEATSNVSNKDQQQYLRVANSTAEVVNWLLDRVVVDSFHSERARRVVDTVERIGVKVPTFQDRSESGKFPIWTRSTKHFSQTALDVNPTKPLLYGMLRLNLRQGTEDNRFPQEDLQVFTGGSSPPFFVSLHNAVFNSLYCTICTHRVQMNTYAKGTFFEDSDSADVLDEEKQAVFLNSLVVGVKVNDRLSIKSSSPIIELAFRILKERRGREEIDSHICVSWNRDRNDGKGGWSRDGCTLKKVINGSTVVCQCNHLTNFAVLLAEDVDDSQSLGIVSICAIAFSIAGLLLTMTVHLTISKLRHSTQSQIIIGLCVNLFVLNFIIILGAKRTGSKSLCRAVGMAMHYFLLASFGWLMVEAAHLHLKIVKVFNSNVSRFVLKGAVLAQGFPAALVLVTLLTAKAHYGPGRYCRLEVGLPFYLGLVTPMSTALLICFIVYIRIQVELKKQQARNSSGSTLLCAWKKGLKASVSLATTFGLTWFSGVILLIDSHAVFQWVFVVFVATQGGLIFIFQVFSHRVVHEAAKQMVTASAAKSISPEIYPPNRLSIAPRYGVLRSLSFAFETMSSKVNNLFFPADTRPRAVVAALSASAGNGKTGDVCLPTRADLDTIKIPTLSFTRPDEETCNSSKGDVHYMDNSPLEFCNSQPRAV